MTSVCQKIVSAEVWLIHTEEISLHNFIVSRKNNWDDWRLNISSKTY